LTNAIKLDPKDKNLRSELNNLKKEMKNYKDNEKNKYGNMFEKIHY